MQTGADEIPHLPIPPLTSLRVTVRAHLLPPRSNRPTATLHPHPVSTGTPTVTRTGGARRRGAGCLSTGRGGPTSRRCFGRTASTSRCLRTCTRTSGLSRCSSGRATQAQWSRSSREPRGPPRGTTPSTGRRSTSPRSGRRPAGLAFSGRRARRCAGSSGSADGRTAPLRSWTRSRSDPAAEGRWGAAHSAQSSEPATLLAFLLKLHHWHCLEPPLSTSFRVHTCMARHYCRGLLLKDFRTSYCKLWSSPVRGTEDPVQRMHLQSYFSRTDFARSLLIFQQ